MGLIPEPKNIDLFVLNDDLSDKEQQRISDFIRHDKALRKKQKDSKTVTRVKSSIVRKQKS